MGKPPYHFGRLAVRQCRCPQATERQAVAVNFISLPGVPGRSYVLDVHEITLALSLTDPALAMAPW
jgi:hypothetical protein